MSAECTCRTKDVTHKVTCALRANEPARQIIVDGVVVYEDAALQALGMLEHSHMLVRQAALLLDSPRYLSAYADRHRALVDEYGRLVAQGIRKADGR